MPTDTIIANDPLRAALRRLLSGPRFASANTRPLLIGVDAGGQRYLAIKTGSFHEGSSRLVRNARVNNVLVRYAHELLATTATGDIGQAHRSTKVGTVHVFAIRVDRPVLIHFFVHPEGRHDVLDEHDVFGRYALNQWTALTYDEYRDELEVLQQQRESWCGVR